MITLSDLPRPFVNYLVGLWQKRWIIVGLAWVFAVIGWGATSLLSDKYESRAQIYLNTDTFLRSFIDKNATTADFEKRVRIMQLQLLSRENMEALIVNTDLQSEVEGSAEAARLVQSLQEGIVVENDEGQYFVIRYSSYSPQLAQQVVAGVVDLFIEQDIGAGIMQSQEAVSKVEREIVKLEQVLTDKGAEIAAFRQEHARELAGSDRTIRELDLLEDNLTQLNSERYRALRNRDEIRMMMVSTPRGASGSEVSNLRVRLAELQSQFNDNYPDIVALKAKIAELEQGGDSLPVSPEYRKLEISLKSTEREISDLQERAKEVRQQINDLSILGALQPAVQAELDDLLRGYAQTEETYKNLLAQQSSLSITASLSEGGGTIEYNIFEAPIVALEPSFPPRGLLTLGIAVLGFGAAVGLVFLVVLFDKTYSQVSDLEEALELPVLGSISPVLTPDFRKKKMNERLYLAAAVGVYGLLTVGIYWYQVIRVPSISTETVPVSQVEQRGVHS